MHRVLIPALAILLAACSAQDESEESEAQVSEVAETADPRPEKADDAPPPIEELSEEELRALARDPEALREVMQDPARRQAIRERLREIRQERRGDSEPAVDRRQAMRERAEQFRQSGTEAESGESRRRARSLRWWENETVASNLGLSEQQATDIGQAHERLLGTSREARQRLAEASSAMHEALKETDRDRLGELVEQRFEALEARARAEAEWMKSLLEILSDEQMQKIAEERPELMGALLAPVR